MPQEILNIIWSALGVLVTGSLSWVTTVLINWLNSKIKDAKLRKWTVDLSQIIMTSVKTISQTYVESLKAQGKFDAAAQQRAFELTSKAVMKILSEDAKIYLASAVGDLNAYITKKIEAEVNINKVSKK